MKALVFLCVARSASVVAHLGLVLLIIESHYCLEYPSGFRSRLLCFYVGHKIGNICHAAGFHGLRNSGFAH